MTSVHDRGAPRLARAPRRWTALAVAGAMAVAGVALASAPATAADPPWLSLQEVPGQGRSHASPSPTPPSRPRSVAPPRRWWHAGASRAVGQLGPAGPAAHRRGLERGHRSARARAVPLPADGRRLEELRRRHQPEHQRGPADVALVLRPRGGRLLPRRRTGGHRRRAAGHALHEHGRRGGPHGRRLHPARVRRRARRGLPGALPPARERAELPRLDRARPGEADLRQPGPRGRHGPHGRRDGERQPHDLHGRPAAADRPELRGSSSTSPPTPPGWPSRGCRWVAGRR